MPAELFHLPFPSSTRSSCDTADRLHQREPGQARVEQQEGIDCQHPSGVWHGGTYERQGCGGGPEDRPGHDDHPGHFVVQEDACDGCQAQREEAVSQHTEGLEEDDVSTQQLHVGGEHHCAHGHDDEHDGEDRGRVRRSDAECAGQHEHEHERSPQVPVSERLVRFVLGCGGQQHLFEVPSHAHQVSFQGLPHAFVQGTQDGFRSRFRTGWSRRSGWSSGCACRPRVRPRTAAFLLRQHVRSFPVSPSPPSRTHLSALFLRHGRASMPRSDRVALFLPPKRTLTHTQTQWETDRQGTGRVSPPPDRGKNTGRGGRSRSSIAIIRGRDRDGGSRSEGREVSMCVRDLREEVSIRG
eukprot:scaffold626_cov337-Pavlova_lutheri.AAC.16